MNATLKWIEENIKDDIDFVIWTGDSARHDSDEKIPRDADQVLSSNKWVAQRLVEVFHQGGDNSQIPIVPTFGNNDILPHNILTPGPNKWLKAYSDIWKKFIPEEQRHGFERGGWFYVEVIPGKLAVFSLNTLYFFAQNAAVDGCDARSEPGYEHMEWLRIQLQFMRQRGMKAILMGHVPPARTDSKQVWDETCWQKYTLWLQQYRDVVVGGLYGHMNLDHFVLQDTKKVDLLIEGQSSAHQDVRATMDDELTAESMNSYLKDLRDEWSDLPDPSAAIEAEMTSKGKKSKKRKKALRKLGGPWGERYQVTHVSPSVVPNFFPTLRIIEYNITGLDSDAARESDFQQMGPLDREADLYIDDLGDEVDPELVVESDQESTGKKKKKKGKKDKKKPKHPDLTIPDPPSKKSPPGPAYSPQTLTLLGYTQYFANLTVINNDSKSLIDSGSKDKVPKPKPFKYEVEYDTFTDPIYKLKDLTVRSYIELAHRIGQYKPLKGDRIDGSSPDGSDETTRSSNSDDDVDVEGRKKKKHKDKKKHRKQHEKNKVWLQFIRRAYVGALSEKELQSFEQAFNPVSSAADGEQSPPDLHDLEL